ncbi:MAG TPA: nucleoside recognition domain-containing protein [Bacteroidaceae bacterium]|nr:nucleoside recognition domain-containing protein [Bacteroidaceae bacterium]
MVLNYIWIALFLIAFAVACIRVIFWGDTNAFQDIIDATFSSSATAFNISIGLTGVLALWLGILRIGEESGLIQRMAKVLSPLLSKLFPDIPKGHPVMGSIFMNIAANMLGLDNAATPMGLKAMEELQELNPHKERASNPMIMFLVMNTSGLVIIPVSIMVMRAQCAAQNPSDIFIPILLSTLVATIAGVAAVSIRQRISMWNRTMLLFILGMSVFFSAIGYAFVHFTKEQINTSSQLIANIILLSAIIIFILSGVRRKINVFEAFVEGAKNGFKTAVRIIPYLVGFLVAIGVFRASGAMDMLVASIGTCLDFIGIDNRFVAALPTGLMRPLSGSGASGLMVDAMKTYGADSFVGRTSCVLRGAADTTFYILAVYFGSVNIKDTRYAVTCGLIADGAGIIAAIIISYLFFG